VRRSPARIHPLGDGDKLREIALMETENTSPADRRVAIRGGDPNVKAPGLRWC
jgi:hypothetical protein